MQLLVTERHKNLVPHAHVTFLCHVTCALSVGWSTWHTMLKFIPADTSRWRVSVKRRLGEDGKAIQRSSKTSFVADSGGSRSRHCSFHYHTPRQQQVRHGTVRFGTLRCGTARYGTVCYGTVQNGTVRCILYGVVRYGMV